MNGKEFHFQDFNNRCPQFPNASQKCYRHQIQKECLSDWTLNIFVLCPNEYSLKRICKSQICILYLFTFYATSWPFLELGLYFTQKSQQWICDRLIRNINISFRNVCKWRGKHSVWVKLHLASTAKWAQVQSCWEMLRQDSWTVRIFWKTKCVTQIPQGLWNLPENTHTHSLERGFPRI